MWDLFISHASEDKDEIARPLAKRLTELGFKVWYDEFSLTLGDSLRESIDKGLSESKVGVVIFSKNFFAKDWPKKELNGLFAREDGTDKVILPIWHKINKSDIVKYSPMLSDRVAVNTNNGLDKVIEEILKVINPKAEYLSTKESTLEVYPSKIDLGSKEWTVKTHFTIKNMTDYPVHAINLKIMGEDNQINLSDIKFELLEKTNIAQEPITSSMNVDAEAFQLLVLDENDQEVIFLNINHLGPQEHKTIVLSNKKPTGKDEPQFIKISIADFKNEPVKLFKNADGNIAVPFNITETCRLKSISIVTTKR